MYNKPSLICAVSEIAQVAKCSKQQVAGWVHRYADFPQPIADLGLGRLWRMDQVYEWMSRTGHLPGGAKRRKTACEITPA